MARDAKLIDRFIAQHPDRVAVRAAVEASGLVIEHVIKTSSDRSWGLVLRMSPALQELFGRRSEVLLWASLYPNFEARAITDAQAQLEQHRPRLSEDFVLVVSASRTADADVALASERLDTVFVGIPMHRLSSLAPQGPDTLTGLLQSRVYSRDLYQLTGAITDPQRFFGRQTLINELEAALRLKGHVGLFGLRKMGKTSLMYRVLERLRTHPSILTAHVDVQRVESVDKSSAYFLWSLGQALFDTNKSIQASKKLRLFGKYDMLRLAPQDVRDGIHEYFFHDVRQILESRDRRIVFIVDEIERMWPGSRGTDATGWGKTFVEVWRLLRGIEQENPGRISYFVTGTSPQCLEATQAAGQENPLHRYIERRFLPHLDDDARRELLTRIGDRIGIKWTEEAIQFVVAQVSGHPSLLRTVGSFVHRHFVGRTGPVTVDEKTARDLFQHALPELNASFRQITEALRESYQDDYMLLEMLACGQIGEYRAHAEIAPDALVHLKGYEVVDTQNESIRLEALQTFLQKESRQRPQSGTGQPLSKGDRFESYEILQSISSGGFGDVYKVMREDGSVAALKVFRRGSYEHLMREVEPLESMRHPNVLRILGYDRAADGSVFLLSEFLDGPTLARNTTRSFRLSDGEAESVLRDLLGALASFHPNTQRLQELRAKDELTAEEAEELQRVRNGYVHRDIKPSNVIVVKDRGGVLIDFGIASRIAAEVRTVSATPGYLPPDFDHTGWTADVDLYQLGLTVMQARLGVHYDGKAGGVAELRELLRKDDRIGESLRAVLLRMTEPEREKRFASAIDVARALGPGAPSLPPGAWRP
jgi:serine/threonine-protein kinase